MPRVGLDPVHERSMLGIMQREMSNLFDVVGFGLRVATTAFGVRSSG